MACESLSLFLKALFIDFVDVFQTLASDSKKGVDQIIITDIYPSREVDRGEISSEQLVDAIKYDNVQFKSKGQLKEVLESSVKEDDVIFFMGAGEIDKIARELVKNSH